MAFKVKVNALIGNANKCNEKICLNERNKKTENLFYRDTQLDSIQLG
jgi:hypothetical protein